MAHTVRGLELGPPLAQSLALGVRVEDLTRAVVQPVLPRGPAVPGVELLPLLVEVAIAAADPIDDLVFDPPRDSGQHVDEAVRVGRNEVHGGVARADLVHRRGDGQPPATRVARETEVAAADEPQDDAALLALNGCEVGVEAVAPGLTQAAPVVLACACRMP